MNSTLFMCQEHIITAQHIREYSQTTAQGLDVPLKLVVKQYTPLSNLSPSPSDLTLVAVVGNGFPKELYEPLWDELLTRVQAGKTFRIRNIWLADMTTQGASGIINEKTMGNEPSWDDHSRDLLHMINNFRDSMTLPIIGVGHSLGASQLISLALMHPALFYSLILLEPYTQPNNHRLTGHALVLASLRRRDAWPSRSAAAKAFRKGLRGWDPRCVELYIQYGLRDWHDANVSKWESVVLTTTKSQETLMMLRPQGAISSLPDREKPIGSKEKQHVPIFDRLVFRPEPVRVLTQLQLLRPSVFYLFGRASPISTPSSRLEKLENTGKNMALGGSGGIPAGRVASVILEQQGHLVPFQAVGACADEMAKWLNKEMGRWMADRELAKVAETPGFSGIDEEYRRRVVAENWAAEDEAGEPAEKVVRTSRL